MIKLIAVDMDGTFLNDDMDYDRPTFRKMYQDFKKKGIKFVVASGNQYYQLKTFFEDYQDELIYVSENGALIIEEKKQIFFVDIPKANLTKIVTQLKRDNNIKVCLCGIKSAYILKGDEEFNAHYGKYYHRLKQIDSFDEIDDQIVKIALDVPEDLTDHILDNLKAAVGDIITPVSSGHGSIDLIVPGFNKGSAIKLLCERYDIALDECIAFGDGGNDIEMLKVVKGAYAMDNGSDAIKAVATEVIESNNDSGVIKTIQKLLY